MELVITAVKKVILISIKNNKNHPLLWTNKIKLQINLMTVIIVTMFLLEEGIH